MKKFSLILIMLLLVVGCTSKSGESTKFTVGVIQWVDHPALNDSLTGMQEGLVAAGIADDVNVVVKNAHGDATNALTIANQFISDKVDLIYAIATPSAQSAVSAVENKDIPIVFAAVTDAKSAGLVANPDAPEANITGVSDLPPLEKQVSLMKEMIPNLTKVGVLLNIGELNSTNQVIDLKAVAQKLEVQIVDKGVTSANEIALAAEQLSREVDALFIINDNMIAAATALVVDQATKEKKPVFMAESGQFDQGILATDSISYATLGQQAGHMIKKILVDKTPISEIAVQTAESTELLVSQKIADALGIVIPTSVLERATVK